VLETVAAQQWVNVETVVDSAGGKGRKVEYEGKSYDYVFDVDIEDGKPPLKLPFNLSENPYDRARKFLEDNELPISYLDNVVQFIEQNTKGATLGESNDGGPDPYGSDARYKPSDEAARVPKVLPQGEYLSITAAKHEGEFCPVSFWGGYYSISRLSQFFPSRLEVLSNSSYLLF